jgi:hypothetical protein
MLYGCLRLGVATIRALRELNLNTGECRNVHTKTLAVAAVAHAKNHRPNDKKVLAFGPFE